MAYVAEQIRDSIDTVPGVYLHLVEKLLGQPLVACGCKNSLRLQLRCFRTSGQGARIGGLARRPTESPLQSAPIYKARPGATAGFRAIGTVGAAEPGLAPEPRGSLACSRQGVDGARVRTRSAPRRSGRQRRCSSGSVAGTGDAHAR